MRNDNSVKQHNRLINVLKGICIMFVIITHFSWSEEERLKYLFPFWIDMAVPIFMIISGYVYAYSYQKNKINSIGEAYLLKNWINKVLRYTIPFFITFLIEEVIFILSGQIIISWESLFAMMLSFLRGGVGLGTYYFPIMIQFIFVYPIIFFIVKKYAFKGVLICGTLNAVFELLQRAYLMNGECYRLLLMRYMLLIAVGCFVAMYDYEIDKRVMISAFVIGIVFICGCAYWGYVPKIIIYWTRTSYMACLYIMPLMVILIRKFSNIGFKPLEVFGKASYNIFLTQIVWYLFGSARVGNMVTNRALHLFINLAVCLGVGYIFYLIETPITKLIIQKTTKALERMENKE